MAGGSGAYGPRLQSRPIRLNFAGWESDTFTLQREGWEISADQDVRGERMSIAIQHRKMGIGGVTHYADWRYMQFMSHEREMGMGRITLPILEMKQLAGLRERVYFHHREPLMAIRYKPVDAMPTYVAEEPKCLEDFVHFASFEAKKILLPHEEVEKLMARILEVQQPARAKHFLEMAKQEGSTAAPKFEAQIMSFAA